MDAKLLTDLKWVTGAKAKKWPGGCTFVLFYPDSKEFQLRDFFDPDLVDTVLGYGSKSERVLYLQLTNPEQPSRKKKKT